MKILLASLMCLVLTMSECFALKGGPVFGGGTNVVGTYAGVLRGGNALGIFTFGVPQTGIGSGTFVMFTMGRFFNGSMQGIADPNQSHLNAVVTGDAIVTETFQDKTDTFVIARADGLIDATISAGFSTFVTSTLLSGSATITESDRNFSTGEFDRQPPNRFSVSGFKQSSAEPSLVGN